MSQTLRIGTRGSDLALVQTRLVVQNLSRKGISATENIVVTRGDVDTRAFHNIQGDGFFTKEIERGLLKEDFELAVHSSKDLPSMGHKALPWVAFSDREDPRDILVIKKSHLESKNPLKVKDGTVIGTSSPRRVSQLKKYLPNCRVAELRGNVPTRVKKVFSADYHAVMLANAGVQRLGGVEYILGHSYAGEYEVVVLPWVTAPSQGIIGVQSGHSFESFLSLIENPELNQIARAEKLLLAMVGGGCHLPIGARIHRENSHYKLDFFLDKSELGYELDFSTSARTVGEALRNGFKKIVRSPDRGPRVWITQPLQHSLKAGLLLAENGLQPVLWPLSEIQISWSLEQMGNLHNILDEHEALIFASSFAVEIFIKEAFINELLLQKIQSKPIFCIGPSTQEGLANYGLNLQTMPSKATAVDLVERIASSSPYRRFLIPGTQDSKVKDALLEKGYQPTVFELYKSAPSKSALSQELPNIEDDDMVVITSPSSAKEFLLRYKSLPQLKKLKVFSIGPTTQNFLKKHGVQSIVSSKSGSWAAMVKTIVKTTKKK